MLNVTLIESAPSAPVQIIRVGQQGPPGTPGGGILILDVLASAADLPETAIQGDAYRIGELLYTYNGTEWISTPGIIGPPGETGQQGQQGPPGPTGPAGPAGPTGPTGANGATGPPGATGPAGETGPSGPAGADGTSFAPDAVGLFSERSTYDAQPAGFAFLASDQGNIYIRQGGSGWSAAIPFRGPQGETGPAGPAGATGAPGPTGPQGETGATGPAGPQGETGPAGPTGATGAPGATGATGATGPAGPNAVTSTTTSDGTADLVVDTLTADTITANGITLGSIFSVSEFGATPPITFGTGAEVIFNATLYTFGTGAARALAKPIIEAWTVEQTLSDAATIVYDTNSGWNAKVTLVSNGRTLAIPTNAPAGSSGRVVITQDGTGGRALTLATGWGLTTGNATAFASMTAGKQAVLSWTRITSTTFASTLILIP
jgi:collagen type VII alpha